MDQAHVFQLRMHLNGKHAEEVAAIVPAFEINKTLINQHVKKYENSSRRANCMNGHRASCILRDRCRNNGTNRLPDDHRSHLPISGYKTLQKPRVQPEKR
ncbi:hypothetical protein [Pseudomonas fluorescens]|uniref:hypothetical protein n=1 Tax=Pseudomonas fluorescens TaxID=294 RepID=UPI00123F4FFC|nr:hypothetical protein [Pseudomonas fluorescens]